MEMVYQERQAEQLGTERDGQSPCQDCRAGNGAGRLPPAAAGSSAPGPRKKTAGILDPGSTRDARTAAGSRPGPGTPSPPLCAGRLCPQGCPAPGSRPGRQTPAGRTGLHSLKGKASKRVKPLSGESERTRLSPPGAPAAKPHGCRIRKGDGSARSAGTAAGQKEGHGGCPPAASLPIGHCRPETGPFSETAGRLRPTARSGLARKAPTKGGGHGFPPPGAGPLLPGPLPGLPDAGSLDCRIHREGGTARSPGLPL